MSNVQASMSAEEFLNEVERHFHYLLADYGFVIASKEITEHFDVCEITLQSKDWRIRIGRERGAVYVYVAPASGGDIWFSVGVVVTFLQRGSPEGQEIWFGPRLGWSLDYNLRLERQLQWYGEKLERHAAQIGELFKGQSREQTLRELQTWKEYKDQQARDALARGDYPTYIT